LTHENANLPNPLPAHTPARVAPGSYMGPNQVELQDTTFPELSLAAGEFNPRLRKCDHGVILKVVTTNICGSDQHMVRGRTTAKPGMVLGHEITGEVIECGSDVEFIKNGDLCSVPFNIACEQ
jgi:glutathione-independent formaldehyde dehydrogenase